MAKSHALDRSYTCKNPLVDPAGHRSFLISYTLEGNYSLQPFKLGELGSTLPSKRAGLLSHTVLYHTITYQESWFGPLESPPCASSRPTGPGPPHSGKISCVPDSVARRSQEQPHTAMNYQYQAISIHSRPVESRLSPLSAQFESNRILSSHRIRSFSQLPRKQRCRYLSLLRCGEQPQQHVHLAA